MGPRKSRMQPLITTGRQLYSQNQATNDPPQTPQISSSKKLRTNQPHNYMAQQNLTQIDTFLLMTPSFETLLTR